MTTVDVRPVVPARYRPGVTGETARTVHMVAHPGPITSGAVSALCGALLALEQIETVPPGTGMPCTLCLLLRTTAAPTTPAGLPGSHPEDNGRDNPPVTAATGDPGLRGWPVTQRRDQRWLSLDDTVALIIPTGLATIAQAILITRRCPAPVLTHPYQPEHHVMPAGEPYEVPLPWPPQVHTAIGTLPLPPTVTPCGPVTWVHPPEANTTRLCREIDIFAAVRTALRDPPGPPSQGRGEPDD